MPFKASRKSTERRHRALNGKLDRMNQNAEAHSKRLSNEEGINPKKKERKWPVPDKVSLYLEKKL